MSVPFIVSCPDIQPKRSDALQQSIDIAPTICDLLGLPIPPEYRGKSILQYDGGAEYVISEHTHRGPCDPINKPVYMSIRTKTHKYIKKEAISPHDRGPKLSEMLFDLVADPDEEVNISEKAECQEVVERFRRIYEQRKTEIREHCSRTEVTGLRGAV